MPVFEDEPEDSYDRCMEIVDLKIKYKDVLDLGDFYEALHSWLDDNGWEDMEDGSSHYETIYNELVNEEGNKEEVWSTWRAQKVPDDDDYYRYHLDIDFHMRGLSPTDIVVDGEKKGGVYKGEIVVEITSFIEPDYDGQWSSHPVLSWVDQNLPRWVFKKDWEKKHKRELYQETYDFQNYIKRWLNLFRRKPYDEEEDFDNPSSAFPEHKR